MNRVEVLEWLNKRLALHETGRLHFDYDDLIFIRIYLYDKTKTLVPIDDVKRSIDLYFDAPHQLMYHLAYMMTELSKDYSVLGLLNEKGHITKYF
mgnify:CR=1 FL=1